MTIAETITKPLVTPTGTLSGPHDPQPSASETRNFTTIDFRAAELMYKKYINTARDYNVIIAKTSSSVGRILKRVEAEKRRGRKEARKNNTQYNLFRIRQWVRVEKTSRLMVCKQNGVRLYNIVYDIDDTAVVRKLYSYIYMCVCVQYSIHDKIVYCIRRSACVMKYITFCKNLCRWSIICWVGGGVRNSGAIWPFGRKEQDVHCNPYFFLCLTGLPYNLQKRR